MIETPNSSSRLNDIAHDAENMASKRQSLLTTAHAFTTAFASKTPPSQIISTYFSSSPEVLAIEHGLPQLAPFLGRSFRGPGGLQEYFSLLSTHLSYEDMSFDNFFADAEINKVSCRGKASFTWLSTGQSWSEVFTYGLQFDEDGKVKVYEVWADSGAAYLASKGELE